MLLPSWPIAAGAPTTIMNPWLALRAGTPLSVTLTTTALMPGLPGAGVQVNWPPVETALPSGPEVRL
jgi:hypothetical protein